MKTCKSQRFLSDQRIFFTLIVFGLSVLIHISYHFLGPSKNAMIEYENLGIF